MVRVIGWVLVCVTLVSFAGCAAPKQHTVFSIQIDLGNHGVARVDHHLNFGGSKNECHYK